MAVDLEGLLAQQPVCPPLSSPGAFPESLTPGAAGVKTIPGTGWGVESHSSAPPGSRTQCGLGLVGWFHGPQF